MSMEEMILRNSEKMKKDIKMVFNFKEKVLFFMLNSKYDIDDLEFMDITNIKIDVILKKEKKSFIIDKKFFLIIKKMKILIVEEKEVTKNLKNNPEIEDKILKIKTQLNYHPLKEVDF